MAVTFPRLNPIIFKEKEISPFESCNTPFFQKWNKEDYIVFQVSYDKSFTSGEVVAKLVDIDGNVSGECINEVVPTVDTYQAIFRVSCNLNEGLYRIKLTTTTNKFIFFSNYFTIGKYDGSMLVEYSCRGNKFDCVFSTTQYNYVFYIRVDGGVKSGDVSYSADDVFYSDQDKTVHLIDSIPYTLRKYTFGDSYGLPVWMADKLNRVLACDMIKIDNTLVVKNDGSKLEATASDAYPYVGLKIELLRKIEGNSEYLYLSESEMMQAGLSIEMIDGETSYSVNAPKTGRIHIGTFENTFN
ncbi:MAG: hypothetical protein RR137_08940 [Odoribacter sp.]